MMMDTLTFAPFEEYATEKVTFEVSQLPKALQLKDFREVMQLETYLEALGKPLYQLSLAFPMKEIAEVEKEHPELIQKEMMIRFKEVNSGIAALSIPIQEVWSWKIDKKNYELILQKFPKISLDKKLCEEEYTRAIEELDPLTARALDSLARKKILGKKAGWLQASLEKAEEISKEISVRKNGKGLPFQGLEGSSKKSRFMEALFTANSGALQKPISFDDVITYQILSVEEKGKASILSFEEARLDGTAEKLLKKRLKAFHKEGSWKEEDFEKVQQKVTKDFFGPCKEKIRQDYVAIHPEDSQTFPESFYTRYRFYLPMREAAEGSLTAWNGLWNLEIAKEEATRYQPNVEDFDMLLSLQEGEKSPVHLNSHQQLCFIQKISEEKGEKNHLMQEAMSATLQAEAKKEMVLDLLDKIVSQKKEV